LEASSDTVNISDADAVGVIEERDLALDADGELISDPNADTDIVDEPPPNATTRSISDILGVF
jgi:hypothetical protein